ncbi:MAG TPA: serine hydrolase domain-containing protein [Gemmatimonadales bacterium]
MLGVVLALALGRVAGQLPVAAFTPATFDPIVRDGIYRGAYPGAVLVVGRRDTVLFAAGYGHLTWSARSAADRPDATVFDLASLSKPVATTTALMLLVDRGRLRLDAPVSTYLPDFRAPGTASITVRMLLTHTSGLRGDLPTPQLRALKSGADLLRAVYAESPRLPPGSRVVYSDLNAVLLGEIVARLAGEPLDRFVEREIFQRLGMRDTRYRPPAAERPRIAPTGVWRGHPVAGEVNDPTAAKLGGVSGNAGVFSTGADLARFAQFLLRGGALADGTRLVAPGTVRLFTTRSPQADVGPDHRALGWQAVPTDETVSSAGTLFGPRSFGHTGWTGTSLWIDPDRDLFVILLTNRAFAPRSRRSFTELKTVRGRLADAAARASDAAAR